MTTMSPRTEPLSLLRRRAVDATGLFWCFVCLFIAGFISLLEPSPISLIFLLAAPFCIIWQFVKWHADKKKIRTAVSWCQQYYPDAVAAPIVDFVVAVAFDSDSDPATFTPDTRIDKYLHLDPTVLGPGDQQQVRVWWLQKLLRDARIVGVDASTFEGETLDAVVQLILSSKRAG